MQSQSEHNNFINFLTNPLIQRNIQAAGYEKPTPIQEQAIPRIIAGSDILGLAQTGTGKTAAFVLPMLQKLLDRPYGLRALIVAPTRELAEQINQVVRSFSQKTRVRSATIYGGVAKHAQVRKLREGINIAVACPGRLLDHIHDGTIDLRNVELLVLDEADQMFDMGFLPNIQEILTFLPEKRQTLLFSATMPAAIKVLADTILKNPETIQIANNSPVPLISHGTYYVDKHNKMTLLTTILGEAGEAPVIVFTRTKFQAMRLSEQLKRSGFNATSIQGNLSQAKRQQAMEGFRHGRFQILIATDIAARGIDVSDVGYVINYDMPDTPEAYTHRVGRTGRADKAGQALTFVTHEDLYTLNLIERIMGSAMERKTVANVTLEMPAVRPNQGSQRPRYRGGSFQGRQDRRNDQQRRSFRRNDRGGMRPHGDHRSTTKQPFAAS